jgi:hypothetical protein
MSHYNREVNKYREENMAEMRGCLRVRSKTSVKIISVSLNLKETLGAELYETDPILVVLIENGHANALGLYSARVQFKSRPVHQLS